MGNASLWWSVLIRQKGKALATFGPASARQPSPRTAYGKESKTEGLKIKQNFSNSGLHKICSNFWGVSFPVFTIADACNEVRTALRSAVAGFSITSSVLTSHRLSLYLGKTCRRTRREFSPMIRWISFSENPSCRRASVIWTMPVVSKGIVVEPSKFEPMATCSMPAMFVA